MKNIFLTALLVLITILLSQVSKANNPRETPEGKELFKRYCAGCHGEDAVGQDPNQPAGGWDEEENRLAPALNGTGHAWHHPPELLFEYIQQGSIDRTSPMPSFGDILNESQISAIVSYFQSMWPNKIKEQYEERFTDIEE
jgi:mono/diheme cytochrome c family protein